MDAYVDESARDGLYVMAAVLVPRERAGEIRASLRDALRRGQRRFHWHEEGERGRSEMGRRIRRLALHSVVVVARMSADREFERARRRCLSRLMWELGARGVTDVLIESRHHGDVHDRRLLVALQRSRRLPDGLTYRFGHPGQEALLWLPDAVAGAASAALARGGVDALDTAGVDVVVL